MRADSHLLPLVQATAVEAQVAGASSVMLCSRCTWHVSFRATSLWTCSTGKFQAKVKQRINSRDGAGAGGQVA